MLIARCPADTTHDRFIASATVRETWVVDRNGSFLWEKDPPEGQVLSQPSADEIWTCETCGAQAEVKHG